MFALISADKRNFVTLGVHTGSLCWAVTDQAEVGIHWERYYYIVAMSGEYIGVDARVEGGNKGAARNEIQGRFE